MSLTCPNCKTELPEYGELEYRFCPRCGAEVASADAQRTDNFQTIPPDLSFTNAQDQEKESDPVRVDTPPVSIPDQTMEPVIPATSKPRPELVPPPGPPPSSFYRADLSHPSSRADQGHDRGRHGPRKPLRLLIIFGAIALLMGGIIYLLLV